MADRPSDYPALVEPNNPELVTLNSRRIKEILELLLGRVGGVRTRTVTVGDLLDLGVIDAGQAKLLAAKRR